MIRDVHAAVIGAIVLAAMIVPATGYAWRTGTQGTAMAARAGYPLRIALPLPPALVIKLPPATALPTTENLPAAGDLPDVSELQVTASRPGALTAPPAGRPADRLLMGIDFDLLPKGAALRSGNGSALAVSKPIVIDGADAGTVELQFGQPPTVLVRSADLARAFAAAKMEPGALAGDAGEFVSFADLRDRGLRVRYDPIRERIEVRR